MKAAAKTRVPSGLSDLVLPVLGSYLAGGLILRLTIRDAIPGVAAWFYATPPRVLLALAVVCAVLSLRRRWWVPAAACALCAWLAWSWCQGEWAEHKPSERPRALRVLCWNVERKVLSHQGVIQELRQADADVLALSESAKHEDADAVRQALSRAFPGYAISRYQAGLLVLVRGRLRAEAREAIGPHGTGLWVDAEVRGHALRLLLFDHDSNPLASRSPSFQRLHEVVAAARPELDLVLGDFNTPSASRFMRPLAERYQHAFATAGAGPIHTWPWPLPVLDLDHIWVARRWQVLRAELGPWAASDHRYVRADLAPVIR